MDNTNSGCCVGCAGIVSFWLLAPFVLAFWGGVFWIAVAAVVLLVIFYVVAFIVGSITK